MSPELLDAAAWLILILVAIGALVLACSTEEGREVLAVITMIAAAFAIVAGVVWAVNRLFL